MWKNSLYEGRHEGKALGAGQNNTVDICLNGSIKESIWDWKLYLEWMWNFGLVPVAVKVTAASITAVNKRLCICVNSQILCVINYIMVCPRYVDGTVNLGLLAPLVDQL